MSVTTKSSVSGGLRRILYSDRSGLPSLIFTMSSPCLICVALTAISLMVFCHSMFRFLKSCESISKQFYDFWFFHALAPHAEDQMHAGVHQVVVILDAEARQLRDQILDR